MRYQIGLGNQPCTLAIPVRSLTSFVVRIKVSDADKINTYLTNRFAMIPAGVTETYYVQMPLAPKTAIVEIFDQSDVNANSFDAEYTRKKMKMVGLRRHTYKSDANVDRYVKLAQSFCYNAGWLAANNDYHDTKKNWKYTIRYLPILQEEEGGGESTTPARVNKYTGVQEVSKRKYIDLTVPERLVINLHEYAHLNLNEDQYNELEADLNALSIYLGLGYPRFEALEVFNTTFYNAPTDENIDRYKAIESYIMNYDNYFYNK